jgi:transcriptional regulator with XRE-family HTH domain
MGLGKNILQARKARGYSLQELSERSGVSRSMLSKIEREEKNPTVNIACQIAEGLNLTLSQLLGEEGEQNVHVIPREKRLVFRDETTGFQRHLLSPSFPSQGIEFLFNVLPAGQTTGLIPAHKQGAKEYLVVARGRLQAAIGARHVALAEGDSLIFEADMPHRFTNPGTEDCEYYLVIDARPENETLT